MYKARRTDTYFREQLNKFIQAAENHARIEKTHLIHCPCKPCKNMRVFSDTTIIRSHVLISGFVDNYMIWNKHGEEAPPPRENQFEKILQDPQFNILFDEYDDACSDDEDVSGGYSNGLEGGPLILAVMMIAMKLMMVIS